MSCVVQDVQSTLSQPASPAGVRERPIGALPDRSPQALVPFLPAVPFCGALPRHSGHPGEADDNPRRTLWRWSRPRTLDSIASNEPPAAPRHAASSHDIWPNLTPRFEPRAERCHGARRAPPTALAGPRGSVFTLKTGSDLL